MANAAEWTKRVVAWRASGLGAAEFCADHGYSLKSLWQWSSKLGSAGSLEPASAHKQRSSVRLARVTRSKLPDTETEAASIVIEFEGARLTVHGRVDAAAVRAVIVGLRNTGAGSDR
jgi:hypothetical protein